MQKKGIWMNLNRLLLNTFILTAVIVTPGTADAATAVDCINIGVGERSQSFTNTCHYPVEIFWCHTRDEAAYRRSVCGNRGEFFQKQALLQPGQVKQNQFAIPFNATLFFAVCPGGHGAVRIMDRDGNYLCQ